MKTIIKLSILLIALLAPTKAVAYDFMVNGIYYNINGNEATVTYSGSSALEYEEYTGTVHIPETVTFNSMTYSVTSVGDAAFDGCSGLTNVTIPNSVTSIGYYAFRNCNGLTNITIPESVTTIGNSAFQGCTALITLNYNAVSCNDFNLPQTSNGFDWHGLPFYGLNISTINIGNSVKRIPRYFACGLAKLGTLTVPNSVESIGFSAFDQTAWYDNQPDGLVYAGLVAYHYKGTMSDGTNISLRNGTIGIGDNAFAYCGNLTSVTIPNSVAAIGHWAFYGCSGLTVVTIPESVSTIGEEAFRSCISLETLNYNAVSCVCNISSDFYVPFKDLNIKSINIGDNVQDIPYNLFRNFTHLTKLTIGKSVKDIKYNSFSGCNSIVNLEWNAIDCANYNIPSSNISHVTIGQEVTVIPSSFVSGSGITSVTIPNSVTSIGYYAFRNCNGLTTITIPESVTSIGNYAFQGCSALETLNFYAISCADFSSTASSRPFYGLSISAINIGNSVKHIPAYFAYGLTGLTSITIPHSVTSIGNDAFSGCSALNTLYFNADSCADFNSNNFYNTNISTINIGNNVQRIPAYFAYGLVKLSNITIPNSVTIIGNYAFRNCSGLTKVSIADLAAWCNISFGNDAANPLLYAHHLYLNGTEVKDLNIPNTITSINDFAFDGGSGLTSITIPNSITSVGNAAFNGCSGLSNVTIPSSVTSIGNAAFNGCSGLSNVTIPSSVTSIGNNAFGNCSGLTKVLISDLSAWCNISFGNSAANPLLYAQHLFLNGNEVTELSFPNTVTTINSYAFNGCNGLKTVITPNSVASIGDYAFYNCQGLTIATIGNSITSIGNYAFQGCSALRTLNFNAKSCANFTSTASYRPFYGLNLSTINIGDSVQRVPAYFAYGMTNLTSITIPKSVTTIGGYAFYGCSGLSGTMTLPKNVTYIGNQAFNNVPSIEAVTSVAETPPSWNDIAMFTANVYNHSPLYVPLGSERAYMSDQCWGQFVTIIGKEIQDEVLATGISLNQLQMTLQAGGTSQLIATVLPDSTTNKVLTWISSNPEIATVDTTGFVTAIAPGSATITATTTDGSNLSASCVVTVMEDLSNYDNYLSMSDTAAFHGETIVIPVKMTNDASIISFQTDIFLPEGIELLQEDGEYLIDPSERMTRTHSIMSNKVSNGAIRVLCYSSNYKPFTGNSGDDLFYITVKVADDAEGDYIIQLKNTLLTNTDFVDLAAPDVAANVNVKAYLLGDANNSGTVTITDVVVTAQYVLELTPQPFVFEAADANVDGNITVADVSRIAWMVLNPAQNAPLRAPALWNNGDRMSAEGILLAVGETRRVSVMLDNDIDYNAFQLDIKLPEGMMASNFHLTDRAGSHTFDVNMLQNGNIRTLCYSPSLTAINGHEGALLTFDVTAACNVNGDILVDGIELVTADCQSVKLDAFTIGVNNATSVNELITGKSIAKVEYFNLAGQRMEQPSTGVTLIVTTYTDGSQTTSKVIK